MEIGLWGDFFRQVGFQLALDVFPDLLLVLLFREKWVEGVGFVELFFFLIRQRPVGQTCLRWRFWPFPERPDSGGAFFRSIGYTPGNGH